MITPRGSGNVREQVREVLSVIRTVLEKQPQPMVVTVQTVFLKDARDQAECERAFAEFYGPELPVTNFVLQPPCGGAALAVEAWAIGGKDVRVEHFGPQALAVSYDSVRWVYCAGVNAGRLGAWGLSANAGCAGAFARRSGRRGQQFPARRPHLVLPGRHHRAGSGRRNATRN